MNPINQRMSIGVAGELLLQIRLLQYKVQAAYPLEDTGNDLIAVNGSEFRAVSVRTTTTGRFNKPEHERVYHVLAVVHIRGTNNDLFLDNSDIYLIPLDSVPAAASDCARLQDYLFSRQQVERLFGPLTV
jgi:hypothetical protein